MIPARNEAEHVAATVGSLLAQDYDGPLSIFVVDDDSTDATAAIVSALRHPAQRPLRLIRGSPLPPRWTGKLWALHQGVAAGRSCGDGKYLLFTDADIVHAPDVVRRLVAHAELRQLVLLSLMAKLRCVSFAERSHVPAFVFFFRMLYPFRWVADRGHPTAAAAGGCVLLQAEALASAGGVASIRGALIDDCALARSLKVQGPIEIALTDEVTSARAYPTIADFGRMISRSAYAQLNSSPLLLAATAAAMTLTFFAPPLLAIFASGPAQIGGIVAWALMALMMQPTLRLYRLSPLWGLALPIIAFSYLVFTLDSALQFARGRGGAWKGRIQSLPT